MKRLIGAFALVFTIALFAGDIKFFDLSWHVPDVAYLEEHLEDIEANTPLDGLTIAFKGKPIRVKGEEYVPQFWNAWANVPWKYTYFKDFVKRMRKIPFRKCKDNFLYLTMNEANFDWFSDKDWKIVADNFGIAARIAKDAGMKGFLFDLEEYGMPLWVHDPEKTGHPMAEAYLVAFQRGQEWGRAVFKEYPNIILFMPFAFSLYRLQKNSILNAFLNGIIDVMPNGVRIYEGDEHFSYRAGNRKKFLKLRENLMDSLTQLVYYKNRPKMERRLRLSPGLYIDAFFYLPPENHYVQALQPEIGEEPDRVKFFCDILQDAMEVADEYVWFYSEYRCWWRNSANPRYKDIWDDAPNAKGLTEAIRGLR